MYNKIATLLLNSGQKNNTLNEIYISQPDSDKEKLGGKLFILLEVEAKKNHALKFISFLINKLEENYYNDDKILMREKIKSLKIENIFESVLAKTNKEIEEYVKKEKLDIDPKKVNSLLGVIYNNQIHFTSTGKNKAFLIYKKTKNYEMLNIDQDKKETKRSDFQKFFNTVVSGEIPAESYFFFSNEALPEYLSAPEIQEIVTTLPPFNASEQIKNKLIQINNYAPFSAIIIKNTEISEQTQEEKDKELEAHKSAQTSLSGLKNTENNTENILSPAGIIKTSNLSDKLKKLTKLVTPKSQPQENTSKKTKQKEKPKAKTSKKTSPEQELPLKDKIFFKKKPNLWEKTKNVGQSFANLNFKKMFTNKKSRRTALAFVIIVILFAGSLVYTNYQNQLQQERENFNKTAKQIEQKQNQVSSYLLYNNEEAAKELISEIKQDLQDLPQEKEYQHQTYQELHTKFTQQSKKVRKLTLIDETKLNKVYEFTKLNKNVNIKSIHRHEGKKYLTDKNNQIVYQLDQDLKETSFEFPESDMTINSIDEEGNFYDYHHKKLTQLNTDQDIQTLDLTLPEKVDITSIENYAQNVYALDNRHKQIYKFPFRANNISQDYQNWLQENSSLASSEVKDIAIDGNIYILQKNGKIHKFYTGEKQEFSKDAVEPKLAQAKKIIVQNDTILILESDRLIQFKFSGPDQSYADFKAQYEFPDLNKDIQDISFDSENNQIYLLTKTSLYNFNLETEDQE